MHDINAPPGELDARRPPRESLRPPCGRLLLSSVEGLVGSVVVPLEVGGAGSLLPRAPVSVEEDACVLFLTGFPRIRMYTSRAASSELIPGFLLI